jgi:hypothetical protein
MVRDDSPEYFPLAPGQYRIYDVDSVQFNDVTMTSDTFRYQLMEVVDSTVTMVDGLSESTALYDLKIYKRSDDTQPWQHTHYAQAGISKTRAERSENNLRFIKLAFPVSINKSWHGNAFLSDSTESIYSPDWLYTYTAVDTTFSHQGALYNRCIVVTQYNNQNLIEKDTEREIYAHGIGLVYKNATHVERQNLADPNWIPEKGFIVTRSLREHN